MAAGNGKMGRSHEILRTGKMFVRQQIFAGFAQALVRMAAAETLISGLTEGVRLIQPWFWWSVDGRLHDRRRRCRWSVCLCLPYLTLSTDALAPLSLDIWRRGLAGTLSR